jgi:putative zinc finger protein
MSHVDDGTLHAYLDGELPATEAHDLEAHVAQCRECHVRLDEERALIARADELLGLAAPPDRAIPPFRPGDRESPVRLWWHMRLPLAWAATVALALGTGVYLGSGALPRQQRAAPENSSDVATTRALPAPAAPTAAIAERKPALKDKPAEPVEMDGALAARADRPESPVAQRERAERAPRAFQPSAAPAPAPAVGRSVGPYALSGPSLTLDSARALVGTDPYAVPNLPVRGIYRAQMIGYAAVVVVQQALDSSTTIDVITGRSAPPALDAVVVAGAAPPADSIGAQRRAEEKPTPIRGAPARKSAAALVVELRGPLSADSLAALQRRLAPLRP